MEESSHDRNKNASVGTIAVKRAFKRMQRSAYAGDLNRFIELEEAYKDYYEDLIMMLGARNKDGMIYLHFAAAGGSISVCEFLLEKLKLDIESKDWRDGDTPLHHASKEGRFDTVAFLLNYGANPNSRNKKLRTPLHCAVQLGSEDIIKLLISRGARIDDVAVDCGSPLQLAADKGMMETVKVLLDCNADPNVFSQDLFSPLMASIRAQHTGCIQLLLEAGANCESCGYKGMTPLGYAVSEGSYLSVLQLIEAGADPTAINSLGMQALEETSFGINAHRIVEHLFPVTSPIPTIPEWNIHEVLKKVNFGEFRKEREHKEKELFLQLKSKGVECFNEKKYLDALQWYSQALSLDPKDAAVLSERSLSWAKMNEGALALEDGMKLLEIAGAIEDDEMKPPAVAAISEQSPSCTKLRANWSEAYYRTGYAKMLLNDYEIDNAAHDFISGLTRDPESMALHHALRDANEARMFRKSHCI